MTKKGATGDFSFMFANKKRFFPQMDNIFLPKKKKCQKKGRPTGHNFGHPLDRKQTFFMDILSVGQSVGFELEFCMYCMLNLRRSGGWTCGIRHSVTDTF